MINNNSDYTIPIYGTIPVIHNDNVTLCYKYAKSLRMFAGIDLFFNLLNGFFYLPALISCMFPLLGYCGAKKFNFCFSYTYCVYLILSLISRAFFLIYYPIPYLPFSIILYILLVYVNLIIIKFTYQMHNVFMNLSQEEKISLKTTEPQTTTVSYVYY